ncbi:MAG: hypothetical protein MZV70_63055 [Desulfobacterales bacterium]|nr:hypothetical protein [Desulfobacterales bacterium]
MQRRRVLVAASHTIATVARDALAQRFGDAIFDVATLAAEMALEASRRKRIGLVASRATADSRRYEDLIRARCPQADVFVAACPLWAPLVGGGVAQAARDRPGRQARRPGHQAARGGCADSGQQRLSAACSE